MSTDQIAQLYRPKGEYRSRKSRKSRVQITSLDSKTERGVQIKKIEKIEGTDHPKPLKPDLARKRKAQAKKAGEHRKKVKPKIETASPQRDRS